MRELDRKIRDGLDRADRLVESFLVLGRAEHGELADRTPVSLGEIVSAALNAHQPEIADKGIVVERDLCTATVGGSPILLTRMVENVIDNAIRHNAPGGWVRVEVGTEQRVARLTIDSGGTPLEEQKVRQLAQPFQRLVAERTGSDNGVGLGLSIVAAIAAAHAGRLALHARPQGGLRVVIELPCARQPVEPGSGA